MAKRDTARVAKRSVQAQEWSLDVRPHKSTKKAKAKERQAGKKEIRNESWYCDQCAVEVYQYRCKHCGKSETEES